MEAFKKCEICLEQAEYICFKCYSYFCEACFKYVHDKKANHDHKKEKIDYFVPIDLKCHEHPKIAINLFCVDEKGKINYIIFIYI